MRIIDVNRSSFFFSLSFSSFNSYFFVVLLKGSQIFSGFGEFSFFHTLTDIPVHECSLGVHQIEFMVKSWEDFSNSSSVGDHAASSHDLSKITSWDDCGRLIVDSNLESSWAPVNELDSSLGLDSSNSGIDILGNNISSVHHWAGHVFSVSGIAFSHHVCWFEAWVSNFSNWELFVVSFFSWDDGGVWWQHEVNSRVGDQVSLEFSYINIQGTIESEGSSEGWDDLRDQSVQVGVGGSFNIEISSADIIDGFVVEHNSNISVFKKGVSWKNWVVGFNNSGWDLRWGIDGEAKFWFFTVIDWKSFKKEWSKSWSSSSSNWVEHKESLKTSTVVSKLSDSVKAKVNNFLSNGVVSSSEVVCSIFFSWDKLFGVEELSVCSGSDLVDDSWFKIEEDASWNVLSSSSLWEESVEGIITTSNGFVWGHLTVRLNSVLEAEEFPAGVTNLDTSLTNVDGDNFSHYVTLKIFITSNFLECT